MNSEPDLNTFRETIVNVFPNLAGAEFRLLTKGWHSTAVDVDDRLIFKFPRSEVASRALVKEAGLLTVIRPAVTMPVPDLTLHSGPPMFSRHEKLQGDHLVAEQYDKLAVDARRHLAGKMALFYAEMHSLDKAAMKAAGAEPILAWLSTEDILAKAIPALPTELQSRAERIASDWQELPPDPYGITYGFFDGHGWNMAFDHESDRLNGIYDFADSGFGQLHQEFIYSNLIARDLTDRIVTEYEILTGLVLDRRRIELLTGAHRLSELAELADDPTHAPEMVRHFAEWAEKAAS
jgi:hypothetical protein